MLFPVFCLAANGQSSILLDLVKGMNSGHAKMADWGMGHLQNRAVYPIDKYTKIC